MSQRTVRKWSERKPSPNRLAYHEAGHVVIAFVFGFTFSLVTIRADGSGRYGTFSLLQQPSFPTDFDGSLQERERLEQMGMTLAAGFAAEHLVCKRFYGAFWTGDYDMLTAVTMRMSCTRAERERYCDWLIERTISLVQVLPYRRAIGELADALLQHGTLTNAETGPILEKWANLLHCYLPKGLHGVPLGADVEN